MLLEVNFAYRKWVSFLGILGFIAFFVYLFFFTNFSDVVIVLGQTNVPVYLLAFVCVIVSMALNALTWYRILDSLSVKTTFRRVFNLSWVGAFVDALVPGGWSGDIFKAYLLSKDQKGIAGKVTASIVVKNVFELMLTLATLLVGIFLLAFNYSIADVVMVAIGVTMIFLALPLVLIIYLSVNIGAAKKLIEFAQRLLGVISKNRAFSAEMGNNVQGSLIEFHDGVLILKTRPKSLIQPALLQALTWVVDILTHLLIFIAIGYAISADKIIITNTIVVSIQTQGVALASFAQVVSTTIYSVLGISPLISITSSILSGFTTFWFKTAIAFAAFQIIVFSRCVPFICKKCHSLKRKDGCRKQTDKPAYQEIKF